MTSNESGEELKVLDETDLVDFYVYCPVCGAHIARISVDGKLEEYRTPCQSCDSELSSHSAVAVPLEYRDPVTEREQDEFVRELKEVVIDYWETTLEEGVTDKEKHSTLMGPNYEKREVEEEVDYTEEFAEVFLRNAQSFGWDWRPPKIVPSRIEERKSYKHLDSGDVYHVTSIQEHTPEGVESGGEVRVTVESDDGSENKVMSVSDFDEMIENEEIVRVFQGGYRI